MDDPVRLDDDASPNNPVGLFENATIEFEDVNLSRRRHSEFERKQSAEQPQTLDQYQKKIEKKMELGEKAEEGAKVVDPNDNINF